MRILLVDDDHIFSDVIMGKLAGRGLDDVTRAGSAEQALRLVQGQKPPFDVYLLDIMLGDMDGIELCRRLRQRADCKSAPIIMITASRQTPLMERAFQAGATDFLRKPLDDAELAGRIRTAMLLVEATARERRRREVLLSGLALVPGFDTLCADERVCFSDVSGMMDCYRLETQLHRLQDGSYHLGIFRIDLPGFAERCARSSRRDSLGFLRAVSEHVAETVPAGELLLSHTSGGRFLCCIFGRQPRTSEPLHQRLETSIRLAAKDTGSLGGGRIDVAVSPLADRPILTKAEAIGIVGRAIEQASDLATATPPDAHALEDNIFHKVEGIRSPA